MGTKMKVVVAFLGLLALSQAAPSLSTWELFKAVHNKEYTSDAEESLRKEIFQSNVARIEEHNQKFEAGKETCKQGVNQFTDMLREEVKATMNGYQSSLKSKAKKVFVADKDGILPGTVVCLSEQQLVSCSYRYGNLGCNGGLMDSAFQYIIDNGGIESEDDYPYVSIFGNSHFQDCAAGDEPYAATLSSYVDVDQGDEDALKQAVATIGPVSVAIDASQSSFMSYTSGVYYDAGCSSTELDHGVLVVGYGTEDGEAYWLVKNSWKASWGEDGYIKMSRNRDNNCGIASQASYPEV